MNQFNVTYEAEAPATFTRRVRFTDVRRRNAETVEDCLRALSGVSGDQLRARLDGLTDLELSGCASVLSRVASR